jgi:hypothetical protein
MMHAAAFVLQLARFDRGLRAAAHSFLERLVRIIHMERDVAHAVAVFLHVFGGGTVRTERCRQHEARLVLDQRVGGQVALPRLEPGVRELGEPERVAIVERGLSGVTDEEFDVMNALQSQRIL